MSLKPFTYPFPETRFLHAGPNVYKFKIRYGDSIREEEIVDKEVIIQELEDSIRAVLANMDSLQPFVTEHFTDLAEEKAEETTMRKRKFVEEPSSPSRPRPHRAKIETSSEAFSNQKPLKETKRLEHSLPGLVVPPLQHSNPPPSKEPGSSGFFGFL
ncbi:hypothetical protein U0070_005051, partial [Myodes glareolus]